MIIIINRIITGIGSVPLRASCNNPAWEDIQEDHPRREFPEIPEIPEFPDNPEIPELSRHPEAPEIPEIPEILIRKRPPEWPRDAIFDAFGSILNQFLEFFIVASREHFVCLAAQRAEP